MRKYPLEPLAALREKKVDDAAEALAEAVRRHEVAVRTLRVAEGRRDAHTRAASAIRETELEALSRGELRVRDLARTDAWAIRAEAERRVLAGAVEKAGATATAARDAESGAQGTLVACSADAKVVAVNRARWEEEGRRAVEAREEEASAEAWRPKR